MRKFEAPRFSQQASRNRYPENLDNLPGNLAPAFLRYRVADVLPLRDPDLLGSARLWKFLLEDLHLKLLLAIDLLRTAPKSVSDPKEPWGQSRGGATPV